MFKAKLIEDDRYYNYRRKQLLLMLLPSIPMGMIINFYTIPIWITVLACSTYVFTIILMIKNQQKMESAAGNRELLITNEEIIIKSANEKILETIPLQKMDKIFIKEKYSIPQETMTDLGKELSGSIKKNNIKLITKGTEKNIDFEVTSYYMLRQLDKCISYWEKKGYPLEFLKTTQYQ